MSRAAGGRKRGLSGVAFEARLWTPDQVRGDGGARLWTPDQVRGAGERVKATRNEGDRFGVATVLFSLTTPHGVVSIYNMKAQLVVRRRVVMRSDGFADLVVWRVATPVRGSSHTLKYSLAYVVQQVCVLRYDNEAGKGDHRHWGAHEAPYSFVDTDTLLADFARDIARWNDENADT